MEVNEEWRPVAGFEKYYQISNLARVKSNDRIIKRGNGEYKKPGRILKQIPNSKGYMRVQLNGNGVSKRTFVHRMVAIAFVSNPNNKPHVNHMDSNHTNNSSSNLEWVTHKENIRHAINKGRFDESFFATNRKFANDRESKKRAVIGTSRGGRTIRFNSIQDAGRYFGGRAGDICRCCKGERKTAQGYSWKYDDSDQPALIKERWDADV